MKWFLYFVNRSISQRKVRIGIACLAVMVGVGLSGGLITLSSGIRDRLGEELKAYGANMMIIGSEGGYINEDDTLLLKRLGDRVENPIPQLYGQAMLYQKSDVKNKFSVSGDNKMIELIGVDLKSSEGMRLYGSLPSDGEVIAGTILRDALKLSMGSRIDFASEGRMESFMVSGFFERGAAEDKGVILKLKDAQRLLGIERRLSAILLRGKGDLNLLKREIEGLIPGSEVKTLWQVAHAEMSLLEKIEFLMALVSIVVLFGASLSVGSTMNTTILERRREIGLMKALGGSRRTIRRLLLAEALLIGGSGGILGFPLGVVSAQLISKGAFGAFVGVPWHLPLVCLFMGIFLGFISSLLPLKAAMRLEPAITLRGE